MHALTRLSAVAALVAVGTACAAKAPVDTRFWDGEDDRTLVILLPGFMAHDHTFEKKGLVDTMRREGLEVDLLAVDLTYPYYAGGKLVDRMREDVLEPAAEQYDHIWVAGISMGGLGTLMTAKNFPEQVEGIVLLSPFVGKKKTNQAIHEVGLDAWQPEGEPGWDEEVWLWVRDVKDRGWDEPRVYLGYGDRDLGMDNLDYLASLMPEDRVRVVPGGHDWKTWDVLLGEFLREDLLQRDPFRFVQPERQVPPPPSEGLADETAAGSPEATAAAE